MRSIPKRLRNEPLIEVIWQAQFEAENAGELLPGVLFDALRKARPDVRMQRLPTADLPAVLTRADPNLRFVTKIRMEVEGEPFIWQVGDRTIVLNCRKPYVGWERFQPAIKEFIDIVERSGVVPKPSRHSLRYLDLLRLDPPPDLSALRLHLQLGGYAIDHHRLTLRVEIPDGECDHVVQVITPANSNLPEGQVTGTLVDLETAPSASPSGWDDARGQLELLHTKSKELFFYHVLSDKALGQLQPEY